jgi:hypothetical protein
MLSIRSTGAGTPSLDEIKNSYGLQDREIDSNFGVVPIDLDQRLFTILVDEAAANRISGGKWDAKGPYSNPRIAPFGPPKSS